MGRCRDLVTSKRIRSLWGPMQREEHHRWLVAQEKVLGRRRILELAAPASRCLATWLDLLDSEARLASHQGSGPTSPVKPRSLALTKYKQVRAISQSSHQRCLQSRQSHKSSPMMLLEAINSRQRSTLCSAWIFQASQAKPSPRKPRQTSSPGQPAQHIC